MSVPSNAFHSVLWVVPSIARLVADGRQQRRHQLADEPVAYGGGQIGHVGRVVGEPAEVVAGQLVGAERFLAELGDGLSTFVRRTGRRDGAAASPDAERRR